MIVFHQFRFKGDLFFEKPTMVPLSTSGLTYLRGVNHDGMFGAGSEGNEVSNGAGKTRLFQLLEGFIYGKNDRMTNFKKFVTPAFEGTLDFENTVTGVRWNWTFDFQEGWTVHRNGEPHFISHQASAVQAALQKEIGLSHEEWCHYLYVCHDSLRILLSGKPKERREYLESFFSIDSFYQEKYDEAYAQLVNLQLDLDAVNAERGRLRELEDKIEMVNGIEWLKHQIWAADSAVQLLKAKAKKDSDGLIENMRQQKDWQSFLKLQSVDPDSLDLLNGKRDSLIAELDGLQKRLDAQNDLRAWTNSVFREHGKQRPEEIPEPEDPRPSTEALLELSDTLARMREKSLVRDELLAINEKVKSLFHQLSQIQTVDRTELQTAAEAKVEEIASLKHRVDILGQLTSYDDGICPTCHQSVTDAVHQAAKGDTLQELQKSLSLARSQLVEIRKTEARMDEYESSLREQAAIKERYDRYPTFGESFAKAQERYDLLKTAATSWASYDKMIRRYAEWETKYNLLRERFEASGGKSLLTEDIEGPTAEKKAMLEDINQELAGLQHYFSLYERIKTYDSLKDLQQTAEVLQGALSFYDAESQNLYSLIADWRVELRDLQAMLQDIQSLRESVQSFEETQERYHIGKTRCDFYSPKGFKLFELKTKCREFVEKCNYWSKIFFQEPYEWSVSDDLDNLDFYVRPAKGSGEPYPIGKLSNGEKNRASRVLLFSQLEMIPKVKRTNLLVLDEVEAFLDQAGARAYIYHVLEILKTTFPQYSIIVVSHLSALVNSGHIDHLWVIDRKKRKSKLTTFPFFTKKKFTGTVDGTSQQGGELL